MARTLEWRELKTGTVALAVIVTVVFSILVFARVGALRGEKDNIYVLTQDAGGVLEGTEVWLSGQKIGLVRDIHFRPITTDTMERLAIHTEILANRMHLIRRDAYADIRPGDNLIGSPIVFISSGTSRAPALKSGDTLINISTGKMKPVGEKIGELSKRLTILADSGRRITSSLSSPSGNIGAFRTSGVVKFNNAKAALSALMNKATTGNGSVALALNGELGARFSRIMAAKDSVAFLVSSGNGSIGRFRKDSTLFRQVAHIRSEVDSLKAMSSATTGVARFRTDSTLTIEIARARAQLSAIMADIKKHPGRYISF
ncbi:MAG TPA: MlaD family protein [Gemmatimonadaceae bacterium]|nr:MlaD family protein [Gemmatimonadaceae bacterium]